VSLADNQETAPKTPKKAITGEEETDNPRMLIGIALVAVVAVLGGLFYLISQTHTPAQDNVAATTEAQPSSEHTCKEVADMTRDVMEHDGYSRTAADAQADRYLRLCYSTGKK
jgi:hypothetical protein